MEKWYKTKGSENDVVQSTRIRLARNLEAYPFPSKLSISEMEEVCTEIKNAVLSNNEYALSYISMNTLSETQAVSLAERFLISPEFASETNGRGLLLSEDESISIMLCEDDHIRIQAVAAGLDLENTFETAENIDKVLDEGIGYAFDERLGYLTQSPADLGTGMKASLIMHLPALAITGNMSRLSATVSKLGLSLRNFYTDGIKPVGNIYQLSNRVTLGISEEAALKNLKSIAGQIVSQERQARESVITDDRYLDKIYRAYGIINSAYMMSCHEFMELASYVRLGAACGLIDADIMKTDELMIDLQPATMNASHGKDFTVQQRDKLRAKEIKEKFRVI